MICSRSFRDRDSRSSFHTTTVDRPEVVEQAMQLRPVQSPAGDLLREQARASGRTQRGTLLR
jgi:hypothetical protein